MGLLMVQVKLPDVDEYGTGCECMIPYAVMASKEIAAPAGLPSHEHRAKTY